MKGYYHCVHSKKPVINGLGMLRSNEVIKTFKGRAERTFFDLTWPMCIGQVCNVKRWLANQLLQLIPSVVRNDTGNTTDTRSTGFEQPQRSRWDLSGYFKTVCHCIIYVFTWTFKGLSKWEEAIIRPDCRDRSTCS